MSEVVGVCHDGGPPVKFALTKGRLPLSTLRVQFPEATGLKYLEGDVQVVLPIEDGIVFPPPDGWGGEFEVVVPASGMTPMVAAPTSVVLAPERKLPVFEGREDITGRSVSVDEFVTAIKHAFERFGIQPHQRGQFLLDALKGSPRVEAKSLLAEGSSVGDVLDYLTESYAESLTAGELQRRLLERRQRPNENVRDFSVDLQRLFLRLQKKDKKHFQQADTLLREQFVDGLEAEGLRHSCRDLLDRRPDISFAELKNWTIQRAERELAHHKMVTQQGTISSLKLQEEDRVGRLEVQMQQVLSKLDEIRRSSISPHPTQPVQQPGGPWLAPNNQVQSPVRCFNCDEWGHFARNCPRPRTYRRQPPRQLNPRPMQTPWQGNDRPQLSGAKQLEGDQMAPSFPPTEQ